MILTLVAGCQTNKIGGTCDGWRQVHMKGNTAAYITTNDINAAIDINSNNEV